MAQATIYRVQRALTSAELASIAAAINAATSSPEIVGAVVTTVFTVLLGTLGERLEDYGPDHRLVPVRTLSPQLSGRRSPKRPWPEPPGSAAG